MGGHWVILQVGRMEAGAEGGVRGDYWVIKGVS